MPLAPYNRRELFLEAIRTRDTSALPDPNNREELFLKDIADQVAAIPAGIPVSVPAELSELLANLPEPHTHTERFYNDIIGALLVATTVTDTTPYITRVTAGGLPVTGTADLKKKLGNTVGVNQLYNVTLTNENNGVRSEATNGAITLTGTSTATGNGPIFAWTNFTIPIGHRVLVLTDLTLPAGDYIFDQYNGFASSSIIGKIVTITAGFLIPQLKIANTGVTYNVSGRLYVIDLTLWFGSNDRIPSDLLSHPENWGRYYAGSLDYEPGRLVSADGTTLRSYDGNGNLLDVTDTGSEVLRGVEGSRDEKLPSGAITRNRAVVDLGTLNWAKGTGANGYFYAELSGMKQQTGAAQLFSGISGKYVATLSRTNADWNSTNEDKVIGTRQTTNYVCIVDSAFASYSGAQVATALSGVMLEYPLATPTTEQGTDFNPGYAVEAGGTESWLQDQSTGVPQGHETEYKEFTT